MTGVDYRPFPAKRLWRTGTVLLALCVISACDDDDDPIDPGPDAEVDVEVIAEGLTAPVLLREAPDGTGRLFVVDQVGVIRIIDADGNLQEEPFLDLRNSIVDLRSDFDERGLLGLAFHPDFAANGLLYVYYSAPLRASAPNDYDHTSRVSEFQVLATDPDQAAIALERVVLEVDQPQFNHNAGTLAFGPDDGYLYISLGDGGGANDVGNGHVDDWYAENEGGNGQDVEQNLLGSILRIDVDGGTPYDIPADNPFVGEPGLDEIWAYGFRNPYRFSFDMAGDRMLIAGDAGQNLWEEVDVVERGGNFGWNVKEGTHCFDAADPDSSPDTCPDEGEFGEPLIDPVIEYANVNNPDVDGVGAAVVGGFVYRGDDIPDLQGQYIFGDYTSSFTAPDGSVFAATPAAAGPWTFDELRFGEDEDRLGQFVLGFGQDLEGEVYVLTSESTGPVGETGRVLKLVLR